MSNIPDRIVRLPLAASPIKAGAQLIAGLAHGIGDPKTRDREAQALIMWGAQLSLSDRQLPEGVTFEEATSLRARRGGGMTRRLTHKLEDRLDAADCAMGELMAQLRWTDVPPQHTRAQRRERLLAEKDDPDEHNFAKRVWRPSLPVLHMACAYAWLAQHGLRVGDAPTPDRLLFDRRLLERLIDLAEGMRSAVRDLFPKAFEALPQVRFLPA